MPNVGPTELIIILVIILIFFGAGKLPELGGALGKGVREFKKASTEIDETKKEIKNVAQAATKEVKGVADETTKEVKKVAEEVEKTAKEAKLEQPTKKS
ncbi:MAG: twin-arginine translocase TatA/TatE family subunit [Anaerolineae bacterium]|nr:twin-arginine translocase TatA/TatE family subunit [Anaerolineae bacterium]